MKGSHLLGVLVVILANFFVQKTSADLLGGDAATEEPKGPHAPNLPRLEIHPADKCGLPENGEFVPEGSFYILECENDQYDVTLTFGPPQKNVVIVEEVVDYRI